MNSYQKAAAKVHVAHEAVRAAAVHMKGKDRHAEHFLRCVSKAMETFHPVFHAKHKKQLNK